jgi:putative flippase GtrA
MGYLASCGVSYFGHMHFSFGVEPKHRTYFWRFLVVSFLSFVLNVAVTWVITILFAYSVRISVIVVSILIPAVNYICNRFWVFLPGLKPIETGPVRRPVIARNPSDPS